MNFLKLLTAFKFVNADIKLYDRFFEVVTNKIKLKDYDEFYPFKRYFKVYMHNIKGSTFLKCVFEINYKNRSVDDITVEIEENLRSIIGLTYDNSIILLYDSLDLKFYEFFKSVIENITKINEQRRKAKKAWEIYFSSISEKASHINQMINYIKPPFYDIDSEFIFPASTIDCVLREYDNKRIIRFRIDVHNYCFFFELNAEEFYPLIKINFINKENLEEVLLNSLIVLSMGFEYEKVKKPLPENVIICESTKIVMKTFACKIEIRYEYIIFKENNKEYKYIIRKDKNCNDEKKIINKECFDEFRKILENISLLKTWTRKKIRFIVNRILYNTGSAMNLIFAHLLFFADVINERNLNKIIGTETLNVNDMKTLIDYITFYLEMTIIYFNCPIIYLVEICILIEAETYLNENHLLEDKIFKFLKTLGMHIISLKGDESYTLISNSKGINSESLIQAILNIKIDELLILKEDVLEFFCKVTSLFSKIENVTCIYYIKNDNVDRSIVIESIEVNSAEVIRNNEILKNMLLKNIFEDEIYERERIRKEIETETIINILLKTTLKDKISKLLAEVSNKEIKNIFYDDVRIDFEEKQLYAGINIIEDIFQTHLTNSLIKKDTINEYKIREKSRFCQELKLNIKENVKRCAKKEFHIVLAQAFTSEFQDNEIIKEKYFVVIKNIITFLEKKDILQFINESLGVRLIEEIVYFLSNTNNC
ncbi:uncharacterized protein VNE69_02117 [Vairimorpha necatrix]|uniref:Uncharacterized protein n=1 Tax=Vairimorpha necatrix TaxID=6039 RepID=A0AAX4J9D7_9MICR